MFTPFILSSSFRTTLIQPFQGIVQEVLFEWSHHRIPSRDSNSHLTKLHQVFWRWKGELEELKLKIKAKQIILFVESKHLLSSIILPINLLLGHNKLMVSCTTNVSQDHGNIFIIRKVKSASEAQAARERDLRTSPRKLWNTTGGYFLQRKLL